MCGFALCVCHFAQAMAIYSIYLCFLVDGLLMLDSRPTFPGESWHIHTTGNSEDTQNARGRFHFKFWSPDFSTFWKQKDAEAECSQLGVQPSPIWPWPKMLAPDSFCEALSKLTPLNLPYLPMFGPMARVLGCLLVAHLALAAPLSFTFMGSTWTMEVEGDDLHVTAECPETWRNETHCWLFDKRHVGFFMLCYVLVLYMTCHRMMKYNARKRGAEQRFDDDIL